ncbi:PAS domain-containing protein [Azospirillum argentinense]|uniref:Chemotaxis protein n=1 Tax=Azospirillum argentinense TaxID=2970906 RepID=A0A2K1FS60_9PROT|nr:PAS domain-containing protein [Azospirillum argentinense]PNQ95377.1 chemotaxis protein [Azospirillum argentinense]
MANRHHPLTGFERTFDPGELIVTKTDLKGRITYANRVFLRISGYDEHEVIGAPHNILRHPDMPACVFKLLWDTIGAGREIFAYVDNRAKTGEHYWVFAHVTPSFDENGTAIGYHSNRRVPRRDAVETIRPLYAQLLAEERRHANPKAAMVASTALLSDLLKRNGTTYGKFIFAL